jgi:1-aminocyclopropane-1-carboxylate deaminase
MQEIYLMQIKEMPFPSNFHLYHPSSTPRFGQINQLLFQEIISLARKEGFFTDPIYTAKLFKETKRLLAEHSFQGNVLIHHSGGALTLLGFEEQLKEALEDILKP